MMRHAPLTLISFSAPSPLIFSASPRDIALRATMTDDAMPPHHDIRALRVASPRGAIIDY